MSEILRLSLIYEDQEWSVDLKNENVKLDDLTWEWLKGAFVAIGFDSNQVTAFFNDSNDGASK